MRQRKLVDLEVHFIWCLRFQFIPYYLKKVTFFFFLAILWLL